ncbi:potassium channel family protein [Desulfovibrio sp. TomC]|uniref:potassium channel family protein n=1 Tax=Desulfovibrio sp. TomC TaxID=1562888 RepID=UPI0009E3462A|nr:potassium channel family protein [Desulfovibrio sp. TomC]
MPTVSPHIATAVTTTSKRFHWLLAALLLQLIASPFVVGAIGAVIQDLLFLGILLAALGIAGKSLLNNVNCVLTGCCAFIVVIKYTIGFLYVDIVGDFLVASVILFTAVEVSQYLSRQRRVDLDTVLGGLCVYMFIGAMWYVLYSLVVRINPAAFDFTVHGHNLSDQEQDRLLFFFSYVSLLTTGYGDIVPISPVARTLSVLEGIAGQFYMVFFMARLVGLHVAEKERSLPAKTLPESPPQHPSTATPAHRQAAPAPPET